MTMNRAPAKIFAEEESHSRREKKMRSIVSAPASSCTGRARFLVVLLIMSVAWGARFAGWEARRLVSGGGGAEKLGNVVTKKTSESHSSEEKKTSPPFSNAAMKSALTTNTAIISSDKTTTTTNVAVPVQSAPKYNAYWCGWPDGIIAALLRVLFDEAQNVIHLRNDQNNTDDNNDEALLLTQEALDNHTKDDVLFVTFQGPCDCIDGSHAGLKKRGEILPKHFQGRILYFNGESKPIYPLHVRDRLYALSHEKSDGHQRIRVHYGSGVLAALPLEVQQTLYDPTKRTKNLGDRFLVYANSKCVKYRNQAFDALSQVGRGPAYYMGKCRGTRKFFKNLDKKDSANITVPIKAQAASRKWQENRKMFKPYRFALVMENLNFPGYMTEKIFNAFLAGCIPIYYGTSEVFDIFNKDSFVFYDIVNPEPAISQVAYLERNQTAYKEMLQQPILANGDETLEKFFSFREEVGRGKIKHQIRNMLGFPEEKSTTEID